MTNRPVPWMDDADSATAAHDPAVELDTEVCTSEFMVSLYLDPLKDLSHDAKEEIALLIEKILSEHFSNLDVQYIGETG